MNRRHLHIAKAFQTATLSRSVVTGRSIVRRNALSFTRTLRNEGGWGAIVPKYNYIEIAH